MKRPVRGGRGGFTMVEVVVALLVLDVALLGIFAVTRLAATTLGRVEALDEAVWHAAGTLDSLRSAVRPSTGARPLPRGRLEWTVDDDARVVVRVFRDDLEPLLSLRSWLRLP